MKSKHKLFAVYDISSSSVAGGHVLMKEENGSPKAVFLASARNDAPLQEDMDIKRFVEETVKNLDGIITRIRKADVHHPSFIQVILASPWYTSQTRTIVYNKEAPFTCSQKLVDSLIEQEIEHILKNETGPFGSFGKESIIVEKQISQIRLNGYDTTTPYGKNAVSLELFLTITISPKAIVDRFTDSIRRAYGTRKIGFTTSPFATFVVMRDQLPIEKECVIIDVGEEVSDVAFIKGGVMLYQHSFPVGSYALYRSLADDGKNKVHEAKAMLESYRLGKLSKNQSDGVGAGISRYNSEWQNAFRQVLDGGQYGFCIPNHCLITGDPRFETIFTTLIKTDPFIQYSCTQGSVAATFISEDLLKDHVASMDGTPLDMPLSTAALFVERLL